MGFAVRWVEMTYQTGVSPKLSGAIGRGARQECCALMPGKVQNE